ncbi:hypothetical protein [Candidatus Parabeggiatoa sp. HSG14]|uniref:hypothetical protein n=1 Tax=Candidatus Parabeggiatoa sp. HSG14 TaxID=3055593 RepID=UPI0025A7DCCE|nr:hypothetical protein [Thiotrichales bacterium HSG14]
MKYDKSLLEVWQWKEEASKSLIGKTIPEMLDVLREDAQKRRTEWVASGRKPLKLVTRPSKKWRQSNPSFQT